jgi:hypothetical protein
VADRVVDEVADQAFGQSRIAEGGRRVKLGARIEVTVGEAWLVGGNRLGGEGRELDALAALESGLAASQGQEPVDQLLEILLGGDDALVRRVARRRLRRGWRVRPR